MTDERDLKINRELIQQLCLEAGRIMEDTSADLALRLPAQLYLIQQRVARLQRAASDILAMANAALAIAGSAVPADGE